MKSTILVLVLLTISISILGQSPSPPIIVESLKPIEIQLDMQEPIRNANRDIELATLKKNNLILQLRLILKVPNDYSWDENSMSFRPPIKIGKKEEKKDKP